MEELEQWCEAAGLRKGGLEGLKSLRYWPQIARKYAIPAHDASMDTARTASDRPAPAEPEPASYTQAEPLAIVDHPRDAREADAESFNDNHNGDLFIEEAVYLTPEARDARAAALDHLDDEPVAVGDVFGDDIFFPKETEFNEGEEHKRAERDGAHGHHRGGHRASRQRGGRVAPTPAPVVNEYEYEDNYDYDYQEEPQRSQPQEQRRGKQTGATGVALGVLSSPSDQDGNYNFK